MSSVRVLVGTKKGAFILTSDGKRQKWEVSGPLFSGWEVYHMKGSPKDPDRIYASQTSSWFGQVILVPAWVMLGLWFALQLFSGIMSLGVASDVGGVAFWAHVGGFIAGVILVWLFRDKDAVVRQNAVRAEHAAWQRQPGYTRYRR